MKRTTTINIADFVFHIDEDAYEKLYVYLQSLSIKFGENIEGKEILRDIEQRIAELMQTKLSVYKQVINIDDVNHIIETIGTPEDIEPDQAETKKSQTSQTSKLYRDPDTAKAGGVCAGLGYFFGVDAWIIRLIAVIMVFVWGSSILAYILLWIFVPKADTSEKKREMKRNPIFDSSVKEKANGTFNNVKTKVSSTFDEAKSKINNEKSIGVLLKTAENFFSVLGIMLKALVAFIGIIIGILLLFALLLSLLAFFGAPVNEWFGTFIGAETDMEKKIIWVFIFMIFSLLVLFVLAVVSFFKKKQLFSGCVLIVFVMWFAAAIIALISILVVRSNQKCHFSTLRENVENLHQITADTVFISTHNNFEEHSFVFSTQRFVLYKNDASFMTKLCPVISLRYTDSNYFEIVVKKSGYNHNFSGDNILYKYQIGSDKIMLDRYYQIKAEFAWQIPQVEVILKIPEGKTIFIDQSVSEIEINDTIMSTPTQRYLTMQNKVLSAN